MKNISIIMLFLLVFGCCNKQNTVKQSIIQTSQLNPLKTSTNDTIKTVEPSIILVNQDSIDRVEFIKDSINFRKITKKINGGYNGFADRYKLWLRARQAIKNNK